MSVDNRAIVTLTTLVHKPSIDSKQVPFKFYYYSFASSELSQPV